MKKTIAIIFFQFLFTFNSPHIAIIHASNTILFTDGFENDLTNFDTSYSNPNTITTSATKSQTGSKSLLLHYQKTDDYVSIERIFSEPQSGTTSIWFWDDMDSTMGTYIGIKNVDETQTVLLGVNTLVSTSNYIYRTTNAGSISNYIPTHIARTPGWHKFELVSTPKGSYGKIDGINLAFLANNNNGDGAVNIKMTHFQKIIIASTWSLASDAYYDNLQVISLDPLPSSTPGRLQTLLQNFANQTPSYFPPDNANGSFYAARQRGNRAIILAILNQNTEEIKTLLTQGLQDYQSWHQKWGAPLPALDIGLASWISWKNLDVKTKSLVKNIIIKEADYWASTNPGSGYVNDTRSEDNGWTAAFLALAANMFPMEPNAQQWDTKAKLFAFHTFTVNESYGGITTQTLYPNYLLDNHNFHPNPHYAISASIGALADGALFYKKTGKPIPEEFKHNVLNVWQAHKSYINFSNYLWLNSFPNYYGKDDWYADATTGTSAFTLIDILSGEDFTSNLTVYKYYILPNQTGSYPIKGPNLRYLLQSVEAKRDAIAFLYDDNTTRLDPTSPHPPASSGDLNGDGSVNLLDFNLFKSKFNNPYTLHDYNAIIANYGK